LNSTAFKVTFSKDLKFNEYFKRLVVECEFVEKMFYDWFHVHRNTASADKLFFF